MTLNELPTPLDLIDMINAQSKNRTDLEKISLAQSVAETLGQVGDDITDHFVQKARLSGHSWAQIGNQLGISKQGAQQRYVASVNDANEALVAQMMELDLPPHGDPSRPKAVRKTMGRLKEALQFQRFNDEARRAVVSAQEQARELRHANVGAEHLLLGLLADAGCAAAKVLQELGVAAGAGRAKIVETLGTGTASGQGNVAFAKQAKIAMELSLRESIRLKHDYIGSEHLLLGLVRTENTASELLGLLGVTRQQVIDKVV